MTGVRVALGSQGMQSSALGLGFMGFTFGYGQADTSQAAEVLDEASALGITLIDTSDHYGPRTNEELLGQQLRGRRTEFQIATKGGSLPSEPGRLPDGRPHQLRRALEQSLRRLGTDHVDLYYLHRIDPLVPIEESIGAMSEFVTAGMVSYIGLSEASVQTIRRAHAVHPLTAVQSEFSIWTPAALETVVPVLQELGIGFVPYSPLGRGYLTRRTFDVGQLDQDDLRRFFPRFASQALTRNQPIADVVADVATKLGRTPAQISLAWIKKKVPTAVPIPGTTRPGRLTENWVALDVSLPDEEVARIDAVVEFNGVEGEPWPAALMSLLER